MNPFRIEKWPTFRKAKDGNVSMIFALTAPFLLLGIAVSIDFNNATVAKSKLNADADAAALAALTPAMMQQPDAVAQAAAISMFNARADALKSLVSGQTQVTVKITHPNGPTSRQVVVSYSVANNTIFSGVLQTDLHGHFRARRPRARRCRRISTSICCSTIRRRCRCPPTQAGITQMESDARLRIRAAAAPSPAIRRAPTIATPPETSAPPARFRSSTARRRRTATNIAPPRTAMGARSRRSTTTRWRVTTTSRYASTS